MSETRIKFDLNAIMFKIEQVGERAVRGVTKVLREEAEEIAARAISNAPVDDHHLENAIKAERMGGGRDPNTGRFVRTWYQVLVDTSHEAANGKTVGDYWLLMHEMLAPYGSGGYNLGPKSQQKAAQGHDVGGKYLERAFADRERIIYERAFWETKKALKEI